MTPAVRHANAIRDAHPADDLVPLFRNLTNALVSVQAVWMDNACWTRDGAAYLGVPFDRRFRRRRGW